MIDVCAVLIDPEALSENDSSIKGLAFRNHMMGIFTLLEKATILVINEEIYKLLIENIENLNDVPIKRQFERTRKNSFIVIQKISNYTASLFRKNFQIYSIHV